MFFRFKLGREYIVPLNVFFLSLVASVVFSESTLKTRHLPARSFPTLVVNIRHLLVQRFTGLYLVTNNQHISL